MDYSSAVTRTPSQSDLVFRRQQQFQKQTLFYLSEGNVHSAAVFFFPSFLFCLQNTSFLKQLKITQFPFPASVCLQTPVLTSQYFFFFFFSYPRIPHVGVLSLSLLFSSSITFCLALLRPQRMHYISASSNTHENLTKERDRHSERVHTWLSKRGNE